MYHHAQPKSVSKLKIIRMKNAYNLNKELQRHTKKTHSKSINGFDDLKRKYICKNNSNAYIKQLKFK